MLAASISSGAAGASPSSTQGDAFQPSASNHGGVGQLPTPGLVQAVPFSSGNPRIEGIMHIFHEDHSSTNNLPVDRKPLLCVLDVPNHMTYADFCNFCGSFVQYMLEMRIVRNEGMEDQYSVLIRFNDQSSTDSFFMHFKGKKFSSLEVDACRVLYMLDIQYTGSIKHAQVPLVSSTEEGFCPVCLERLEQDDGAILITICNHSFHCSCISKWADSSCPVCRHCQQQPEKSACSICGTSENLWMCLICGFVGCGSYKEGHAIRHWIETQHCFSLELGTRQVWDYVENNYVYRMLQSKPDGKIVELTCHAHDADDTCESRKWGDSGISDALVDSKFDAILVEYNDLLTSQFALQRKHFESLLQELKEEDERAISNAIEKAISARLQKLHAKLNKSLEEKRFLEDINENLLKNQEIWQTKFQQVTEREQVAIRLKDEKIQHLEEQLKGLITSIEAQNTLN
ncbi:hypothetical protein KSP39_PZI011230 [Platanthera zijinensis]|uniref:BRCA1-associated protein n=1 Tax=Platanthera zijinensis TaxID=2320716 RepID=A0AAP0G621_9ASPA